MAVVEAAPGLTISAEDIRAFLAPRIAKYKIPRNISFQDTLPREESGKIFKSRLRDPFWKAAGRSI
jgi:long-chain acyl-CoA synthetase